MTTLNEMTVEHLGDTATETDLEQFKAAVERYMDEHDVDETDAIDAVWNNGSWTEIVERA